MKILSYGAAALLVAAITAPVAAQQAPANERMRSGADPDGRQGVLDPNGPAVPPGDGISVRGHDPEGQAFTPPGYNLGTAMRVYPPTALAPLGLIGGDYPVCSARVTDRCVQGYSRYTRTASRR